jgi:hypothetical protein
MKQGSFILPYLITQEIIYPGSASDSIGRGIKPRKAILTELPSWTTL